ncbi:MAG: hypothetical protein LN412_04915 [Candidatus Thermoplasmatota archaeon]|nr:hypothetical protein [Candidatus Thermoplasmatota archaeon]
MARPVGVTILAVLVFIAAILLLTGGITVLLVSDLVAEVAEEWTTLVQVAGAVAVLMGILFLIGGVGLIRLTLWGWWLAIIASLISVASNISQVVVNPANWWGPIPGLVIALIILVYLFVVREHFGARA